MLKQVYEQLLSAYATNEQLVQQLWMEIEKKHSEKGRYYHTLTHLENLIIELTAVREDVNDWPMLLFAVFYHDSIYKVLKSDNEEKSALLANERMIQLNVPAVNRERCNNHILATKAHQTREDADTNLFTDADLAVLGKPWEVYEAYSRQIRSEYRIYPDLIYNPGRKKVLAHFLQMDKVYKTPFFYGKYEQQARHNMQRELSIL